MTLHRTTTNLGKLDFDGVTGAFFLATAYSTAAAFITVVASSFILDLVWSTPATFGEFFSADSLVGLVEFAAILYAIVFIGVLLIGLPTILIVRRFARLTRGRLIALSGVTGLTAGGLFNWLLFGLPNANNFWGGLGFVAVFGALPGVAGGLGAGFAWQRVAFRKMEDKHA